MEDLDVIAAFVHRGAKSMFGPTLHIEGDALLIDGWWPAVYRVAPGAFITRGERPPTESDVPEAVAGVLSEAGLTKVGSDFPGIAQITYTSQYSLGYVPWDMWAADLATAHEALAERATEESFIESRNSRGGGAGDFTTEYGGARRVAGLPPAIVITVGVADEALDLLEMLLPECHMIGKEMGGIRPDACGALIPTLMIVDGTNQQGRDFMMELRAVACGRTIPVLAVSDDAGVPLGANASVRRASDPATWVQPIRDLLPS